MAKKDLKKELQSLDNSENTEKSLKVIKEKVSKLKKEPTIDIEEPTIDNISNEEIIITGDKVEPELEIEDIKTDYSGIVARGEFFIVNGERFREAIDAAIYNYKIKQEVK